MRERALHLGAKPKIGMLGFTLSPVHGLPPRNHAEGEGEFLLRIFPHWQNWFV